METTVYVQDRFIAQDPAEIAELNELREIFFETFVKMKPIEAFVMIQRYGLDGNEVRTLVKIARQFKRTRERIRTHEANGLRRLHHPANVGKLKAYEDIGREVTDYGQEQEREIRRARSRVSEFSPSYSRAVNIKAEGIGCL